MTHRDIAQVIPSVVSLFDAHVGDVAHGAAPRQTSPPTRRAFWERGLRTTLAYRDDGHEDRFFDIGFADMRADPIAEMARLYDWLGDELSVDARGRACRRGGPTNPADAQGAHEYHPEDYGIDLDDLRHQFAFYNDRFVGPPRDPASTGAQP